MRKIASLDMPVGEDENCSMYGLLPYEVNEDDMVIDKISE